MTNPFDIEALEQRQLLSITWVNRGKADKFDAIYKADANVARQIVDAAIADWNEALPKAKVKVRISAFNIEGNRKRQNTLGRTSGKTVQLDSNGAGQGWYFDPDLSDDSDFSPANARSPYHATGSVQGVDFYSVALHELGHAFGFADKKKPYTMSAGRQVYRDPHHAQDADDLMYPFLSEAGGGRRLISPYDVLHTPAGRTIKSPVLPRSFFAASATQGETQLRLNWSLPSGAGEVKVYRSTRPGATPDAAGATLLATPPAGQGIYFDTSASPGVTYYYFVVSAAEPGLLATASGWLGDAVPLGADAVRASVESTSPNDAVRITWTLLDGATSYDVYKSATNAGSREASGATLFGTVSKPSQLALDGTVGYGKGVYYWVVAHFGTVTYDYPTPARIYRMSPTETATVTASFDKSVITLTPASQSGYPYSAPTGVDHYDVYRSLTYADTREASGAELVGSFGPSDRNFYDFGAPHDANVYYWVVAVYAPFPDVTVTRDLPPVGGRRLYTSWLDYHPDGGIEATKGTSDSAIDVSWTPVPGAGGYDIYVLTDFAGDDPVRPSAPVAHVSDPAVGHWTFDSSTEATGSPWGWGFYGPGPHAGVAYSIWVVATPGSGLASATPVGNDRGYLRNVVATEGIPNGIDVSWSSSNWFGYGINVFRSTVDNGSFAATNPTLIANSISNHFLDTTAQPGVTYHYWIALSGFDGPGLLLPGTDTGYRP